MAFSKGSPLSLECSRLHGGFADVELLSTNNFSWSSRVMPRHQASRNALQLSSGCTIRLMCCISLVESDLPGDLSDDLGIFLLTLGLDVLKAQRQSGTHYGPQGKYKTNKVKVIIDGLFSPETSDREFKAWLGRN
ncbi:hypothetical protein RSAG8_13935, partial [Rhizoctonia solani AG-8 WAC10335]